jgi:hypothetical protein
MIWLRFGGFNNMSENMLEMTLEMITQNIEMKRKEIKELEQDRNRLLEKVNAKPLEVPQDHFSELKDWVENKIKNLEECIDPDIRQCCTHTEIQTLKEVLNRISELEV